MEVEHEDEEWPAGAAECEALEEAVHCSICRDYFNTPLSLLCGHSFCSQCIRSNIQFQERNSSKAYCPQCREPTDSRQIHANHQLREIVKHFLLARSLFIQAMKAGSENGHQRKKRRIHDRKNSAFRGKQANNSGAKRQNEDMQEDVIQLDSTSEQEKPVDGAHRQLRKRSSPVDYFPDEGQVSDENEKEVEESDASSIEESEYESSPSPQKKLRSSEEPSNKGKRQETVRKMGPGGLPNNWAQCPVCSRSFPMAIFNDHLDRCLKDPQKGPDVGGKKPEGKKSKLQVPPKLLLSLEKDKSLRDRLKKYGLSTKGTRQELEQRYSRFRVEVQSALDRGESNVTYSGIAQRIMGREVSENQASAKPNLLRTSHGSKKAATGQGSEFDNLIKMTRARDATHSGKMGSTTTVVPDTSERGGEEETLETGEDHEVCSQPKDKASLGNEKTFAGSLQNLHSTGFRRPNKS